MMKPLAEASDRVMPSPSYALSRENEQASEVSRLERQAAVPFPLEWTALIKHDLSDARCLLDLGPGAGAYLSLIAASLPELHIAGAEANVTLADQCRRRLPDADIVHADATDTAMLTAILADTAPDVVMARYLLQHLPPDSCARLLDTLKAGLSGRRFICIDADDTFFIADPPNPAITALNERMAEWQAARGGDRFIGRRLATIFEAHGFSDIRATPVLVASQEVGLRNWWHAYGPAYRRTFDDFEASATEPLYRQAEDWVLAREGDRGVWLSKIIHIVSGVGAESA